MSEREWHYIDGEEKKGPISENTLRELLQKKIIDSGVLIWAQGMDDWKKANAVFPEFNSLSDIPPPIPEKQKDSKTYQFKPVFKKIPVILVIIYTVITFGIYYPVWFLMRREEINRLESDYNLGKGVFIFSIVMFSLSLVLMMASGFFEGLSEGMNAPVFIEYSKNIEAVDKITTFIVVFTLLFQCFKVKRIFQDHFNEHLSLNIKFSGLAVFFFQINYLQYKINRFD